MTTQNYNEAKAKFGFFLGRLREKRGMSQIEVSKMMGYSSPQFLSNIERGTVLPPIPLLSALTSAYGVKPMEIFGRYQGVKKKRDLIEFMGASKVKAKTKKPLKVRRSK